MIHKGEIKNDLKRVLEFYQSLGFDRLPIEIEKDSEESKTETTDNRKEREVKKAPCAADIKRNTGAGEKAKALKAVRAEIGDCKRCRLSKGRKNIVFGEGASDAELMFIGEGPGREEDIQGRPFVGDAGKVLTNLILKMGLKREEVYIANIVKCRPPMNRDPESDEIKTCSPFLEQQIDIIQPRVIVALGRIAAQRMIGSMIPISKLRGKFYDFKGIPVMPTFHPAYLIRNPKDKWLTWDDAQKVLEKLKK
ncbi:MAG: uracil-DNA glycosylase [Nitrospiraceae bacterium]|nr:MAG: uracil-DNA glycosylase [Nitrospiraceae bacterium]